MLVLLPEIEYPHHFGILVFSPMPLQQLFLLSSLDLDPLRDDTPRDQEYRHTEVFCFVESLLIVQHRRVLMVRFILKDDLCKNELDRMFE
jgi:hypothetical protein